MQAIVFLRAVAVELPPETEALEQVLRGTYRTFAANAKFVNAASLEHVAFMSACVVEIYGLDPVTSYTHAFTHVRQLALLLRTALVSKTCLLYTSPSPRD